MRRAIITSFHAYQPYGHEYYEPILNYFVGQLKKYQDEYSKLYILDSGWGIEPIEGVEVIKSNPNLRYYEAYKAILPQIKESNLLFLDNDMVIYRKGVIADTFSKITNKNVVSIYDTIGEKHFNELGGQSKFCLYYFAVRKKLLERYTGSDWGPVHWGETLSELTLHMLGNGIKPVEQLEDKTSIYLTDEGILKDPARGKNIGYYHIRAGSVPALLLAYRDHDTRAYEDYIGNQPKREYLRQFAWYWHMGGNQPAINRVLKDVGVKKDAWGNYMKKFVKYHGL